MLIKAIATIIVMYMFYSMGANPYEYFGIKKTESHRHNVKQSGNYYKYINR